MKIQTSAEDYLESILVLSHRKDFVRSIDVANELGFSKPSVSVAVKGLKESGYIRLDESGNLFLTDAGKAVAEKIYERHCFIADLLIRIGINDKTAHEDACRIEHVISEETFEAIKKVHQK